MYQHWARLTGITVVLLATVGCAAAASTPSEGTLSGGSKKVGEWTVTLYSSPNPPIRGINTLEARVTDANGKPITDAAVSFDLDMTNMSHGKNVVVAASSGNGRYAGRVSFMMPGPWRVIVSVQRPGQPEASGRFNFSVSR